MLSATLATAYPHARASHQLTNADPPADSPPRCGEWCASGAGAGWGWEGQEGVCSWSGCTDCPNCATGQLCEPFCTWHPDSAETSWTDICSTWTKCAGCDACLSLPDLGASPEQQEQPAAASSQAPSSPPPDFDPDYDPEDDPVIKRLEDPVAERMEERVPSASTNATRRDWDVPTDRRLLDGGESRAAYFF